MARKKKAEIERKRGRPSFTGETGQRYQVTIPPSIEERVREYGDGSLSQGIIRLITKRKRKLTTLGYLHRKAEKRKLTESATG